MNISTEELQKLLTDASAGPWDGAVVKDIWTGGLSALAARTPEIFQDVASVISNGQARKDSTLASLAPTLAARVIEQERIIAKLAEDASRAADLEAENARLRGWLSEIDMRGKQYDGEDMADLARDALNGKPLDGVQP